MGARLNQQAVVARAAELADEIGFHELSIAPEAQDAAGQAASEELLAVIGAVLQAYRLGGDDLIDAIRILRSALHGFIALEQTEGFKQPRPLDATFKRLIASLDLAFQGWEPSAGR